MPGPITESLATDFRDSTRESAQFREDFAGSRGRVETQLGFLRWLGTFTAAILVTLVGGGFWLSWHASGLNQRVDGLKQRVDDTTQRIEGMSQRVEGMSQRIGDLERTTTKVVEGQEQLERTMTRIADRLDPPMDPPKPRTPRP